MNLNPISLLHVRLLSRYVSIEVTYALCLGWQAPMVVHIWRAPSSLEMNLRNDHQPHGQEKVDEPVDNSAKHARVVLSKVVRTALLVLLLDGGTVVRCQVFG